MPAPACGVAACWKSFARDHGEKPYAKLQAKNVRSLRDEKAGTPRAANLRLKALRALFRWAIEYDFVVDNPTRGVEPIRYVRSPFSAIWIVKGRFSKSSSARRARNASGVRQSVWITRHEVLAEMLVHRGKGRVDLGLGLRRDVVGMVRVPHIRMRRICDDMAVRRRDVHVAEPPLPTISLGDGVDRVSRHAMSSRIGAGASSRPCVTSPPRPWPSPLRRLRRRRRAPRLECRETPRRRTERRCRRRSTC